MNQFAQNPQMMNPYMNAQKPVNGILWVQGIEGAKAYQLPPSSNVMLLDSDTEGRFYIKTSDNIGMCNLRIFEYTEITDKPQNDMSNYVTKEELEKALKTIKGGSNEQSLSGTAIIPV